ncbi:hypothetical protein [Mannheimia indoligenes]|uniref:hypothetical protein n=1 Tax=Mannheimia indoligenes TaxID=3103145 RepID=UPI002FE6417A
MNKLFTVLTLAMVSHYSFAAVEKPVTKPLDGKPAVAIQIFDVSGKVAKPIQGNKLNIAKKQNRLCWNSINVPVEGKVMIAEAIYAPAKSKAISEGSQVQASPDGTSNTIITNLNNVTEKYVSRCWDFDKTDPIGKYKMDVQINDQVFKGLEFEIVK